MYNVNTENHFKTQKEPSEHPMNHTTIEQYSSPIEQSVLEKSANELDMTMEQYRTDPNIQELILSVAEARGVEVNEEDFASEELFMRAAQRALDFRNGAGRDAVKPADLGERADTALQSVIEQFGMRKNTEPANPDADMVFVLGSAGAIPGKRLDYAVELIEAGKLNTNVITLVGSERPIAMQRNAAGLNELDRAGVAGYNKHGIPAATEFDLLRNTAAEKFDIADEDWQIFTGRDPRVPAEHNYQADWRIAFYEKNGMNIFVTSAPMLDENRIQPNGQPRNRSNTIDGFIMASEMLRDMDAKNDMHTVMVTDAIYNTFQDADGKSALAPRGITSETVGYTREHAGLPEWPGGNALYIQETLSVLRQTRAARDTLAKSVVQQTATQ